MTALPWRLLGIARTSDQAAIRRAYARELKAIDVDADPGAFIALRQAFEVARNQAARAAARPTIVRDEPHIDDARGEGHADETSSPVPEARPAVARPAWIDHIEVIQALIFGERSREAIAPEVRDRAARLFGAPEMQDLDHAARIEQWTADVILSGIPRSNALMTVGIEQFGWRQRFAQWDCPPLIRAVLGRYADAMFVTNAEKGNSWSHTYRCLIGPGKIRPGDADTMQGFLTMLRGKYPTVLREVPSDRVKAWDALIAKRADRPIARFDRWWSATTSRIGRFVRRTGIFDALKFVGICLGVMVAAAFVIGTGGVGLIVVARFLPGLLRSMRR